MVEIALALPILLLLVLGIADLGRVALYSIAVTHAARDAAAYAVQNLDVTDATINSRVCDELSLQKPACAGLQVHCFRGTDTCSTGKAAPTVRVSVQFDLSLLTGMIVNRLGVGAIPLHSDSTFAGYTQ
ncbi:MAG: pilus assembly protein [Actinomycetota bacterium]|nr:pilus assembly protein [Actinomycetota bacterium]